MQELDEPKKRGTKRKVTKGSSRTDLAWLVLILMSSHSL